MFNFLYLNKIINTINDNLKARNETNISLF